MSRGGRGGGRGGRGGGNAARDSFNAAFAGMNKEDARTLFESFSKPLKGTGMLYPPLDKAAELPGPTPLEESVVKHGIELTRLLADGPVVGGVRKGAPWRLASERQVVGIEIESYSDRFRRPASASASTPSGTTVLDSRALHLRESLFPPGLWSEYFDADGTAVSTSASTAAAAARARERARKRKRLLEDGGGDGDGDEEEEDEDDDMEDDFDSDAEEDHQDYDHNYFDNGEGDDDSAGEGGDDEGGRYDD